MKLHYILTISCLLALSTVTHAVGYDIEFTRSSYQVKADNSFNDLFNAHNAGRLISTQSLDGFNGIDTKANIQGSARNHSIMLTTSFYVKENTEYDFQVGADWGRGGGIAIINADTDTIASERVISDDIWWNKQWDNKDVISTNFQFTQGNWKIIWLGFEGCCSGSTSIRYSENGAAYAAFTRANFLPQTPTAVPLPGGAILFGSALALLITRRKKA